jgi:hypothetical protein
MAIPKLVVEKTAGPAVQNRAPDQPAGTAGRSTLARERLSAFLDRKRFTVLDVGPSAAPGGRRLLVGVGAGGQANHAVALAESTATDPLDTEDHALSWLVYRLRPDLQRTVPRVVEWVDVDTCLTGLVVTGVAGLRSGHPDDGHPRAERLLAAVDPWLGSLWQDTAGPPAQVDLGSRATSSPLMQRYAASVQLEPVVGPLESAHERLADCEVPQTLCHGCLCQRHIRTDSNLVIGVDDWGLALTSSDPLRDLGGLASRIAGPRLAEVVGGRSGFARLVRAFVSTGLERLGMPSALWRDVLVLAQLELAVQGLERGEQEAISHLVKAVRALPRGNRSERART